MTSASAAPFASDADYHEAASRVLAQLEAEVDRLLDDDDVDIDAARTGGMVELRFPDRRVIVVNTQPPLHEIWLASPISGRHFRYDGSVWRDTRDGTEFFTALSEAASLVAGAPLRFVSA